MSTDCLLLISHCSISHCYLPLLYLPLLLSITAGSLISLLGFLTGLCRCFALYLSVAFTVPSMWA